MKKPKYPKGTKKNPWRHVQDHIDKDGRHIIGHYILFTKTGSWKAEDRKLLPKNAIIEEESLRNYLA